MKMFDPANHTRSPRHRAVYAFWEICHTVIDFLAAMLFLVGSVLFFYQSLENPAIWCFVIGSICFALKPTLKLVRELNYLAIGDLDDIAGGSKDRA